MNIAVTYGFLALLATAINIGTQDFVNRLVMDGAGLYLPIAAGTATGLISKYILDKKFIFCFRAAGLAHDSRVFLLYSMTGVGTTVIFWGMELSFHFLFGSLEARYLGGVIGLAMGYFIKYKLDKKYVF